MSYFYRKKLDLSLSSLSVVFCGHFGGKMSLRSLILLKDTEPIGCNTFILKKKLNTEILSKNSEKEKVVYLCTN